jgi:Ca-activated chloride channel family protein
MEGNMLAARGSYAEAIGAYTQARSQEESAPYAEYGIGLVYLSMEAWEAALERFDAALEKAGADGELIYRIRYNAGVARFEERDFSGAAADFRGALEADRSRVEAKRNLELSLLSEEQQPPQAPTAAQSGEGGVDGGNGGEGEGRETLFTYLRQKEQDRWKSQDWGGSDPVTSADY